MNTYRNRRTGQIIKTACPCSGENWEEVATAVTSSKSKEQTKQKAVKNGRKKLSDT